MKRVKPGVLALFIFLSIAAGYFMVQSATWTYDQYVYWKHLGGGQ